MRIAFFGGSFDPPHCAHLAIANAALERLGLDRILFAPAGRQPLKREAQPSSYADRCKMVQLAIAGSPAFELSLLDAPQPDGRPNYSIDTLQLLKSTLLEDDQLFCLMGADSFLTLPQWRRAAELLVMCDFIIASRPGFGLGNLRAAVPAGLPQLHQIESSPAYEAFRLANDLAGSSSMIYVMHDLNFEVSATEIRAALVGDRVGGDVLPAAVLDYIKAHRLYSIGP